MCKGLTCWKLLQECNTEQKGRSRASPGVVLKDFIRSFNPIWCKQIVTAVNQIAHHRSRVVSSEVHIRKEWLCSERTAICLSLWICLTSVIVEVLPWEDSGKSDVFLITLQPVLGKNPKEIWFPETNIRNVKMNKKHLLTRKFSSSWLPTFLPTAISSFLP